MKYQDQRGKKVVLANELGKGGEASVFAVQGEPKLVAKVYHAHSGKRAEKLKAMVDHPPREHATRKGHISICWPERMLFDEQRQCVGFLMPKLDRTTNREMLQFYNPQDRKTNAPNFTWEYLVRAAMNVSIVMETLHNHGYVVGDVNESNFFISDEALVTIVDCDSMQVRTPECIFHCTVAKPEYLPPEMHGVHLATTRRGPEQDNFALAILLFLLLMEGVHPYSGAWKGAGDPPPLEERIRTGDCAYVIGKRVAPMPAAPPFEMLPVALQALFKRAFGDGHAHPSARPSAYEWRQALASVRLARCKSNPQHSYSEHVPSCPWCARKMLLQGSDAFPNPAQAAKVSTVKQKPLPQRRFRSVAQPAAAAQQNPAASARPPLSTQAKAQPVFPSSFPVRAHTGTERAEWFASGVIALLTLAICLLVPQDVKEMYGWAIWLYAALVGVRIARLPRPLRLVCLCVGAAAAYILVTRRGMFYAPASTPLWSMAGALLSTQGFFLASGRRIQAAVVKGTVKRTAFALCCVSLLAPLGIVAGIDLGIEVVTGYPASNSAPTGGLFSLRSQFTAASAAIRPTLPRTTHLNTCSRITSSCDCAEKTEFRRGESLSVLLTSNHRPNLYMSVIWPGGRAQALNVSRSWRAPGGLFCASTRVVVPTLAAPGSGRVHLNEGLGDLISVESPFNVMR
ncbi:helix-hairpin-helix domain-containing protein [Acidipila sp. EB88]|uniref:helix-hairpin-helix domain-containing protein n=1 Tax=Acidipila sp. EB88 TaxID=2305226 RepID=UPI000F5F9677|nr:hypothetical protein [Acidipila sp. EB88]RRA47881.1 hypothetical protein D1Y84_05800 [Acidipila sp. EB88]